ncbi:suppressor for copper-sensitivity B [Amylibacter ulvae]|uniref:Suppressor for copper-sensitivity B n=1 Tax=Paramylibacter ulvae TaxID=1651968 RepID=A0ABQ3D041_9RHOB|nr:protein-disulfide reductase DsbD domain-containing protein [Amylibacter ulvae]GHA50522.1 suppressor for copper-sensitivity B [Amylibacter ulvae]
MLTRIVALLTVLLIGTQVSALESKGYFSHSLSAKLISAHNGVAPDQTTVSAALHITLKDDWKTYWRSPGEVGLPPEIDWSGSANLANVDFQWPAPTRFSAFGIENFGYKKSVTFPLHILLTDTGKPATLDAKVNLLVCSDICIPETFELNLEIANGVGIDGLSARRIANSNALIPPLNNSSAIKLLGAEINKTDHTLIAKFETNDQFVAADVFPEYGQTRFGKPQIITENNGAVLWAKFPILQNDAASHDLRLTIVNGKNSASFDAVTRELSDAPFTTDSNNRAGIWWIVFIALVGGVILNIMPCVLPVLSIKITSAIKARNHSLKRIKQGFWMSTLGVLSFMWLLAATLIIAKSMGHSVGWGIQFQSPYFLTFVISMLLLFAANMIGIYEFTLPQSINSALAESECNDGLVGDYLTGAFAALLATPCSAPFLGTAVAFALSGNSFETVATFTALGVGLALPYIALALRPTLICYLPKPGAWMNKLKFVLGGLLAITAIWLATVLFKIAGVNVVLVTVSLAIVAIVILAQTKISQGLRKLSALAMIGLAMVSPIALAKSSTDANAIASNIPWQTFNRNQIPTLVSQGKTVFVDVTADWCLTCKANKTLVIERDDIANTLAKPDMVAMVADWTKPDDAIAAFLSTNQRYGIPFNIVYGPNAPNGIPLPEVLTTQHVLDALKRAAR